MNEKAATPENPNAFPSDEIREREVYQQFQGMTLRDYFAAKAMQAALTGMYTRNESYSPEKVNETIELASKNAYYMADLMLKARQQ